MIGYLPADANAEAIVDGGWYRTGDIGSIDGDGWVTISDRVKEMIKVNGNQVAPAEIEAVLLSHQVVIDCAVFGVPHQATGEAVVAAVVLASPSGTASAELAALVESRLASYKRVHDIVVVDVIPRLPSGKVLRRELKASYQAGSLV
jgi:acyl-CoA synthetase (AMP-forming)/AMP-acid ligase II